MTATSSRRLTGRNAWFLTGAAVFAASFLIPAVRFADAGRPAVGWQCALLALRIPPANPVSAMVFGAGLLNLVAIGLAASRLWRLGDAGRTVLAFACAILLCGCWAAMLVLRVAPLAGHFAWAGGIAMMAGTEVWNAVAAVRS